MVEAYYETNATFHTKEAYIVSPAGSVIITALWIFGEQGNRVPNGINGYTVNWCPRSSSGYAGI
eukprot:10474589-Prorocentrum_lima.AAC.1